MGPVLSRSGLRHHDEVAKVDPSIELRVAGSRKRGPDFKASCRQEMQRGRPVDNVDVFNRRHNASAAGGPMGRPML